MATSRLYIKYLPANWNEFDVYRLFKGFGHVQDVHLPPIKPDFTTRYGFVELRTASEATTAKGKLDGIEYLDALDEVPADFQLPGPLQVDWCQENYRKSGRSRSPYRKRQDSTASRSLRSTPVQDAHSGRTTPTENAAYSPSSCAPRSSPETTDMHGEKQKLNSSEDSGALATCDLEAVTPKIKASGPRGLKQRFGRFNINRHVPVFLNSLKRTVMEPERQTQVLVTHFEAPNEFYVILGKKVGDMCHFHDSMSKFYTGSSPLRYCPAIGEVCVAEYVMKEETLWFRVAVLDNSWKKRFEGDIPDRFECFFLDRGFRAWIDKEKVRPIDKKFQEEPVEAVQCGLYGIQPRSGEGGRRSKWSEEALKEFGSLVDAADSITATAIQYCGGRCLVELKLKEAKSGVEVDCAEGLISKNLAEVVHSKESNHLMESRFSPEKVLPVPGVPVLKKYLRIGDLKKPRVTFGKNTLLSVTRVCENGDVFVVCVQEEATDDYLQNGLLAVEKSHNSNCLIPGYRPKAGDVVTWLNLQCVYSRGLVLDRPVVPERISVENLETGHVFNILSKDAHPAEIYIGEWPPCRIKCRLKKGNKLPENYEKKCVTGVLNMKKNGDYELEVCQNLPSLELE